MPEFREGSEHRVKLGEKTYDLQKALVLTLPGEEGREIHFLCSRRRDSEKGAILVRIDKGCQDGEGYFPGLNLPAGGLDLRGFDEEDRKRLGLPEEGLGQEVILKPEAVGNGVVLKVIMGAELREFEPRITVYSGEGLGVRPFDPGEESVANGRAAVAGDFSRRRLAGELAIARRNLQEAEEGEKPGAGEAVEVLRGAKERAEKAEKEAREAKKGAEEAEERAGEAKREAEVAEQRARGLEQKEKERKGKILRRKAGVGRLLRKQVLGKRERGGAEGEREEAASTGDEGGEGRGEIQKLKEEIKTLRKELEFAEGERIEWRERYIRMRSEKIRFSEALKGASDREGKRAGEVRVLITAKRGLEDEFEGYRSDSERRVAYLREQLREMRRKYGGSREGDREMVEKFDSLGPFPEGEVTRGLQRVFWEVVRWLRWQLADGKGGRDLDREFMELFEDMAGKEIVEEGKIIKGGRLEGWRVVRLVGGAVDSRVYEAVEPKGGKRMVLKEITLRTGRNLEDLRGFASSSHSALVEGIASLRQAGCKMILPEEFFVDEKSYSLPVTAENWAEGRSLFSLEGEGISFSEEAALKMMEEVTAASKVLKGADRQTGALDLEVDWKFDRVFLDPETGELRQIVDFSEPNFRILGMNEGEIAREKQKAVKVLMEMVERVAGKKRGEFENPILKQVMAAFEKGEFEDFAAIHLFLERVAPERVQKLNLGEGEGKA